MLRFFAVIIVASSTHVAFGDLETAQSLLLTGRYEEAEETFSALPSSTGRALGLVTCLVERGNVTQAIEQLAVRDVANESAVLAKLAFLHYESGTYDEAKKHADKALAADSNDPIALFVRAELLRTSGRVDEAAKVYETLSKLPVEQMRNDGALHVGRAIAIHGRNVRDTRVFDRLVNDFYRKLLQKNPKYWPAHVEIGKLFLEKYNEPAALRSINAALAINPRAAEIHGALGRISLEGFDFEDAEKHLATALRLNPNHVDSLRVKADLALHNRQMDVAFETLKHAAEQHPFDERTLGRAFAVFQRMDGQRASQLAALVRSRNAKCGEFYAAAARAYEAMRIVPKTEEYYELAIERSPHLIAERGELGLTQMRMGEEAKARKTLEEAFRIDPFNVRVKNTLEVLDLLNRYAVIETEHFVLRFDRGHDGMLAEHAARYLEETVYPDIVESLGYAPKDKTLLEIFSRRDGTSGHSWFSARMVGLPFIGTVGACAGKMFALTSPADGKPYNWARVLRHEFVHVVNLQQTGFQIPHWFTEALAVRNEAVPYPADWDMILAKYVANDELFDLTNINHGFTSPGSGERWTLAYYQAYLYADYVVTLRGEDALGKLIEQYAQGASTEDAIQEVVEETLVEFETGYREYLNDRVKAFALDNSSANRSLQELAQAIVEKPNDASALAELSELQFTSGRLRDARSTAEKTLKIDAGNAVANGVLAQLMFSIGEDERGWSHVKKCVAAEHPPSKLIALAANRRLEEKDFEDAVTYFRLGLIEYPKDPQWNRGLARVYLASGDKKELIRVLSLIAEREPDKVTMARKLTQLTLAERDFVAAEKWANRVIHVDVTNPVAHAELAKALAGQGKTQAAIREYKTALKLVPTEAKWLIELKVLERKL